MEINQKAGGARPPAGEWAAESITKGQATIGLRAVPRIPAARRTIRIEELRTDHRHPLQEERERWIVQVWEGTKKSGSRIRIAPTTAIPDLDVVFLITSC